MYGHAHNLSDRPLIPLTPPARAAAVAHASWSPAEGVAGRSVCGAPIPWPTRPARVDATVCTLCTDVLREVAQRDADGLGPMARQILAAR